MSHCNIPAAVLPDSPALEQLAADDSHAAYWSEFESNIRDFNAHRATHCEQCDAVTAGTRIGGELVQLCDRCLSAELRRVLADIEAAASVA